MSLSNSFLFYGASFFGPKQNRKELRRSQGLPLLRGAASGQQIWRKRNAHTMYTIQIQIQIQIQMLQCQTMPAELDNELPVDQTRGQTQQKVIYLYPVLSLVSLRSLRRRLYLTIDATASNTDTNISDETHSDALRTLTPWIWLWIWIGIWVWIWIRERTLGSCPLFFIVCSVWESRRESDNCSRSSRNWPSVP